MEEPTAPERSRCQPRRSKEAWLGIGWTSLVAVAVIAFEVALAASGGGGNDFAPPDWVLGLIAFIVGVVVWGAGIGIALIAASIFDKALSSFSRLRDREI